MRNEEIRSVGLEQKGGKVKRRGTQEREGQRAYQRNRSKRKVKSGPKQTGLPKADFVVCVSEVGL